MSKQIKYSVNDSVFWLSGNGFRAGKVKKVSYSEELDRNGNVKESLTYRLWATAHNKEYEGDAVKEDFVFQDYDAMIDFYKNNPPNQ